jgi:PadR family transcriptional regulator PadR
MVASRADGDRPGADRSSQLLKGVLEMCLLAVIEEEPSYGYEMVRKLADRGLVEGYLVESPEGPARKYYRIAPEGRATLEKWSKDWQRLVAGVEKVLGEGAGGG